jgi:hypothetical protein
MDLSFETYRLWNLGWRFYRGPRRGTRTVISPQGGTQVLTTEQFKALCRATR